MVQIPVQKLRQLQRNGVATLTMKYKVENKVEKEHTALARN
jgi:hypothetical protein